MIISSKQCLQYNYQPPCLSPQQQLVNIQSAQSPVLHASFMQLFLKKYYSSYLVLTTTNNPHFINNNTNNKILQSNNTSGELTNIITTLYSALFQPFNTSKIINKDNDADIDN
eukprot:UN04502